MERESMYPPRFTIEVGGEEAVQSSTLEIRFEGAQEDIDTEIQLKHIGGGTCTYTGTQLHDLWLSHWLLSEPTCTVSNEIWLTHCAL